MIEVVKTYTIRCDEPGCDAYCSGKDGGIVWREAGKHGWDFYSTPEKMFCKEHRKFRLCWSCDRPMRPIKTTPEQYPNTVMHNGNGICQTCYQADAAVARNAEALQQAVEDYLACRTYEFNVLFLNGDDIAAEAEAYLARVGAEDLKEVLALA